MTLDSFDRVTLRAALQSLRVGYDGRIEMSDGRRIEPGRQQSAMLRPAKVQSCIVRAGDHLIQIRGSNAIFLPEFNFSSQQQSFFPFSAEPGEVLWRHKRRKRPKECSAASISISN